MNILQKSEMAVDSAVLVVGNAVLNISVTEVSKFPRTLPTVHKQYVALCLPTLNNIST